MGLGMFGIIAVVGYVGTLYRESGGIPLNIPYAGNGTDSLPVKLQLYETLIYDKPCSWRSILLENYTLWFVLYSLAHLAMYVEPQRKLFRPFKLNKMYPKYELIVKEFFRSARGVMIASALEVGVNHVYSNHLVSDRWRWSYLELGEGGVIDFKCLLCAGVFAYLWGDAHFYWTHRWLHTKWLYKNVHKIHHESFNPDPWSGLSMHWFESALYFSSAPLMCMFAPLWMVRFTFKGLLVFPLEGHSGHGSWALEDTWNHYIHHSKFNWNYGSSPTWDHIMGTNYDPSKISGMLAKERYAESIAQAKLVGATISDDLKGIAEYKSVAETKKSR